MADGRAIEVGEASSAELAPGTRLLADALGFSARDALPAWLMQDAQEAGALVLAARARGRLAGFSVALPAFSGEQRWYFSCGLAVEPGLRSHGIGRLLKLAQRDRALERGVDLIRWRADPLNAAGLRLYLDGLGARLTGYRADLYAGVREHAAGPHDDVDIEWRLGDAVPSHADGPRVELPWEVASLAAADARRWRLDVREAVRDALARDRVGVGLERDPAARRAWLRFGAR